MEWEEQEQLLQDAFDLTVKEEHGEAEACWRQIRQFKSWHPDGHCYLLEATAEELDFETAFCKVQHGERVLVRRHRAKNKNWVQEIGAASDGKQKQIPCGNDSKSDRR